MGLPVRFVCTVNSNDIVARTVEKGDFSKAPQVVSTLAPAMDIQVSYWCGQGAYPQHFITEKN